MRNYFFEKNNDCSENINILIGAAYDARATTLARIENISEEELHWQFAYGWNSISCLLEHILCLKDTIRICCIEKRKFTKEESEIITPALEMGSYIPTLIGKRNLEQYKTLLNENLIEMKAFLKSFNNKNLWEKSEINGIEENINWWLYHIIEDEVHHRGQISIISKLYNQFKKNIAES